MNDDASETGEHSFSGSRVCGGGDGSSPSGGVTDKRVGSGGLSDCPTSSFTSTGCSERASGSDETEVDDVDVVDEDWDVEVCKLLFSFLEDSRVLRCEAFVREDGIFVFAPRTGDCN